MTTNKNNLARGTTTTIGTEPDTLSTPQDLTANANTTELLRWHQRLNHLSFRKLNLMASLGIIPKRLETAPTPRCACTLRYKYAMVFVDQHSRLGFVYLQRTANGAETLKAKRTFEAYCADHNVRVQHYHADNGRFCENRSTITVNHHSKYSPRQTLPQPLVTSTRSDVLSLPWTHVFNLATSSHAGTPGPASASI